jgi:glyoxylase-like metal-dependent hydrolase (beta-lactamase superfamily II)
VSGVDPSSTVEALAPGLWSVRVPIPDNPLGFVFTYVFETTSGPVLVDPGWDAEESYRVLADALVAIGSGVASVYGVLVTHHHRDHSGLAPRVAASSAANVAMHEADADILRDPTWFLNRINQDELEADGVPAPVIDAMREQSMERFPRLEPAQGIRHLGDGELADVPGWRVETIWTPGHTPGHLCFVVHLADRRLLLSGDHVLPRITPNVGLTSRLNANPLLDYRTSLRRVLDAAPDAEVLPAHEWRFTGLPGRVVEIEQHHDARLAETLAVLSSGPMTAWQVATTLTWKRPWTHLDALGQHSALNEARAHLAYLHAQGRLTVDADGDRTYRIS